MNLTVEEAFNITLDKREYLKGKALKKIQHELGRNKYVPDEELDDLVSDTVTATIIRLSEGKAVFEKESELLSYIIQSNWWNYRDAHRRNTLKKEVSDDDMELLTWIEENNQPIIYTVNEHNDELDKVEYASHDRTKKIFRLNPKDKAKFLNINYLPEIANETYEDTEQHKSDTYYAELTDKVFTHLEDCVINNVFSFRDAGLFKMFVVNGYSNATELADNTDYTIAICRKVITKIKKHLKTTNLNK